MQLKMRITDIAMIVVALVGIGLMLSVPANCQQQQFQTQTINVSGQQITITNNLSATTGAFGYVIQGGPSTISLVIAGCPSSGACTTLDTYTAVFNTTRNPTIGSTYTFFTVTGTWTGGTSVSITVNSVLTGPSSSGGAGTVNAGTIGQLAYYAGTGTAVSGSVATTTAGGSLAVPNGQTVAVGADVFFSRLAAQVLGIGSTAGAADATVEAQFFLGIGGGHNNFYYAGNNDTVSLSSTTPINFKATADAVSGTADVNISRFGVGTLAVGGNGTQGDTTGKVEASGYFSAGTKFTTNAGCGESAGTTVGGATAGQFTTAGTTSCTTTITFGNSPAPPNSHWHCSAEDRTTAADFANPHITTDSATTVTLVSGTIVASDVISFSCTGY